MVDKLRRKFMQAKIKVQLRQNKTGQAPNKKVTSACLCMSAALRRGCVQDLDETHLLGGQSRIVRSIALAEVRDEYAAGGPVFTAFCFFCFCFFLTLGNAVE